MHTFLVPPQRYPNISYEDILERKEKIILGDNLPIYVLEVNDDFIYAACHMCKHLVNEIVKLEETYKSKWKNLFGKQIYDMACMIDSQKLEWETILGNAIKWDVVQDVLLACKMINYFLNFKSLDVVIYRFFINFLNQHIISEAQPAIDIVHANTSKKPNLILSSSYDSLYSSWDNDSWKIEYCLNRNVPIVAYVSLNAPIYGLHAITLPAWYYDTK